MSILVFVEHNNQQLTPYALQALHCAKVLAKDKGTTIQVCVLASINDIINSELSSLGISKLYVLDTPLDTFCGLSILEASKQVVQMANADLIICSHYGMGKILAPQLSVMFNFPFASSVVTMPVLQDERIWKVKRMVFSGKAVQTLRLEAPKNIISIQPNIFPSIEKQEVANLEIVNIDVKPIEGDIQIVETIVADDKAPSITEANIVVSGGMGMGSPDNWHLIDKLADKLGAAKACTRLVSDAGWRPHHEHVGQTGTTITPKVYIAIGISGAIQHLAGVNQSQIIIAINKDKDAPIFEVADYGIVGDALEILPQLINGS